jgi:hypothetical protein
MATGGSSDPLATARAGLFLDRALAWQEQFRKLGWWDTPGKIGATIIDRLIQQGGLPNSDEPHEPWVLICEADGKTWRPHAVHINNKSLGGGRDTAYIVATRCRLVIFDTKDTNTKTIWYKDINEYEWQAKGDVRLKSQQGDVISWNIHVSGPGLFDLAVALAGTDPIVKHSARRTIEVKAGQQVAFMELIGEFLKEIYAVME